MKYFFFFSSRRRHTRLQGDWSSDVCSSDLDRRGDPLGRLSPDITGDEYAGHASFQVIRRPVERPSFRPLAAGEQVGPGEYESALVPLDDAVQPARQRRGTDE